MKLAVIIPAYKPDFPGAALGAFVAHWTTITADTNGLTNARICVRVGRYLAQ